MSQPLLCQTMDKCIVYAIVALAKHHMIAIMHALGVESDTVDETIKVFNELVSIVDAAT